MRNGSLILFWIAIMVALMTIAGALGSSWNMVSSGLASPYEDHSPSAMWLLLVSVSSGLSSAAWPFFGSAVLWLVDKRFPVTGPVE
jgi:hypothetical protein